MDLSDIGGGVVSLGTLGLIKPDVVKSALGGTTDAEKAHLAAMQQAAQQIGDYRHPAFQTRMNYAHNAGHAFAPIMGLMQQLYGAGAVPDINKILQDPSASGLFPDAAQQPQPMPQPPPQSAPMPQPAAPLMQNPGRGGSGSQNYPHPAFGPQGRR